MSLIWEGLVHAVQLLFSADPEVLSITGLSLRVSGIATLVSLLVGLPLGTLLALGHFPTRRFWISLVNTGMALPPWWWGWPFPFSCGALAPWAICA